jgi:hypothetical protein
MSIKPDLMSAILSMDAYNQGYGAGLTGVGNQIGTAKNLNIDLPIGSQDAGFAATAYSWNGQTVISYRGTDNPSIFSDPIVAATISSTAGRSERAFRTLRRLGWRSSFIRRSFSKVVSRRTRWSLRGIRSEEELR